MVVRIFSFVQHVLVAREVWFLISQPAATLYTDGVTAVQVRLQLCTVTTALIVTTLEVLLFKEDNL